MSGGLVPSSKPGPVYWNSLVVSVSVVQPILVQGELVGEGSKILVSFIESTGLSDGSSGPVHKTESFRIFSSVFPVVQ